VLVIFTEMIEHYLEKGVTITIKILTVNVQFLYYIVVHTVRKQKYCKTVLQTSDV
jgi:hypothetical protein